MILWVFFRVFEHDETKNSEYSANEKYPPKTHHRSSFSYGITLYPIIKNITANSKPITADNQSTLSLPITLPTPTVVARYLEISMKTLPASFLFSLFMCKLYYTEAIK